MPVPREYVALQPYEESPALKSTASSVVTAGLHTLRGENGPSIDEDSHMSIGRPSEAPHSPPRQDDQCVGGTKLVLRHKESHRLCRAISQYWLVEAVSWVASLLLFAAIIGLLAGFDGQSIPQWRYGITLSTLVSLLATIATFTVAVPVAAGLGQLKWIWFCHQERPVSDFEILESASTGPFGSFLLILKWKGGIIAIIGALLTILTLAINPFVQQVILFETRLVNVTQASLPRALRYDTISDIIGSLDIDLAMKSAITNGLLNLEAPPELFDVTPECSTGNCTWPSYQSLAVCSSCKDLTSQLTQTFNASLQSFNNTLPNGISLLSPQYHTELGLYTMTLNSTGNSVISTIAFPSTKSNFPLLDFFAITGPYNITTESNTKTQTIPPYAAECILQFCIQSYTAHSTNGTFHETPTGSPQIIKSSTLINNPVNFSSRPDFSIYYESANYLEMYLSSAFSGQVQGSDSLSGVLIFPNDVTQAIFQSLNSTLHTLDSVMANTAKAMTLDMRTRADAGTPVFGNAAAEQSFIRIEWPWMALPLGLLVLVLIFFVVVAVMTREAGLEPWKDSSVATLFHGLDDEGTRLVRGVNSEEEMAEVAERYVVRMERGQDGWSLRRAGLKEGLG